MKRFLKALGAGFLVIARSTALTPAMVSAVSSPSYFKKIGDALVGTNSAYTLGDASNRWDIFADTADITTLSFSGFAPGDVAIDGNISVDGSVLMDEQSAAIGDTDGVGQLWVKDDSPNTLYFTDDTGTDVQLGAGGGGGFADWVTVGTADADYTDVSAAIADTKYKIALITDITEDSDIAVPSSSLYIMLNDYTLTMGANQFTYSTASNMFIEGLGPDSKIDYTQTVGGEELIDTGANTTSVTTLRNFTYDNNSSAVATELVKETGEVHLDTIYFEGENLANFWLHDQDNARSTASNLFFTSPGTTASVALTISKGHASNITFMGTWTNSANVVVIDGLGTVRGLYSDDDNHVFVNGGTLIGYKGNSNSAHITLASDSVLSDSVIQGDLLIQTSADNIFVSNVDANDLDFLGTGSQYVRFSNFSSGSAVSFEASRSNCDSCKFLSNLIIEGDGSMFNGLYVLGTTTFSSTADENRSTTGTHQGAVTINGDRNSMSNSRVGTAGGGGSNTINISAAADSTLVIGNFTDAAISDSGTNTIGASNIIY